MKFDQVKIGDLVQVGTGHVYRVAEKIDRFTYRLEYEVSGTVYSGGIANVSMMRKYNGIEPWLIEDCLT